MKIDWGNGLGQQIGTLTKEWDNDNRLGHWIYLDSDNSLGLWQKIWTMLIHQDNDNRLGH